MCVDFLPGCKKLAESLMDQETRITIEDVVAILKKEASSCSSYLSFNLGCFQNTSHIHFRAVMLQVSKIVVLYQVFFQDVFISDWELKMRLRK